MREEKFKLFLELNLVNEIFKKSKVSAERALVQLDSRSYWRLGPGAATTPSFQP